MTDTVTTVGMWALALALIIVGFILMIAGIMDIGRSLGGKSKEWGKATLGFAIGVGGGFLIGIGATRIFNFYKNNGADIPLGK
ncbi:MAG: hypothetical protein LBH78_03380 [Rickettsiales bacterium]|jgi:uncharacterized membrane protein HdeD (DUF308 family)|nr:hypothetical protein [Rickettsiales bacterium]